MSSDTSIFKRQQISEKLDKGLPITDEEGLLFYGKAWAHEQHVLDDDEDEEYNVETYNIAFENSVAAYTQNERNAANKLSSNIYDYTLLKVLGSGAYGKVYLGIFKRTKVEYAIKLFKSHNNRDDYKEELYAPGNTKREIDFLLKTNHQNIIKAHKMI